MDISLNASQREAVEYIDSPLLVVAGAGSGKTRVLTAKIAYLLEEVGLSPYNLMAVTFTNKAASEMIGRVRQLVGPLSDGVSAGTFHSFCAKLLRRHGEHLGYRSNFSIYDESDQLTMLRKVISELDLPERTFPPAMVRALISRVRNEIVVEIKADCFGDAGVNREIYEVYLAYQCALKESNAMDFDDLLLNTLRLFEIAPEVAEDYQERFRYLLVDEYQDTNCPQYHLVRILSGRHRGLCVVGDPDQSIYSWRGADIRNILNFERDYPDARVVILDQNYRSTQGILSAASALIDHNPGRHKKVLWSELGEGAPVHHLVFLSDEEEARGIARIIQAKRRDEGRGLGDIVLLYRTNGQSRVLEHALSGAGLNYTIVGGFRFYERAEIKDTLAYLRYLVNPLDTVSLARAMGTPRRGIGEVTLGRILGLLEGWGGDPLEGLEAAADEVGRAGVGLRSFASTMKKFRAGISEREIGTLARDLLEEVGYFDMLISEDTVQAQSRLDNLGELLSGMEEFTDEYGDEADLPRFLEEVSLLTEVDEWEEKGEAVTLMTLHSAKGLEYPIVFITGMEEELCPMLRSTEGADGLEEERRLCYVGMTRAKEELYLTRARRRRRWGNVQDRLPSRFLGEIPVGLIKTVDQLHLASHGIGTGRARRSAGSFDEAERMDVMPDYEDENQDQPGGFRVGQRVEHPTLGCGRILEVSGRGEKTRLVVAFGEVGTKRLMAKYAKLRVMEWN